jgi:hypothetical protein
MLCTNSSAFRINFCTLQTSVYITANWFRSVVTLRGLPILRPSGLMKYFPWHLNTSLSFSVIYCLVPLGMASIDICDLCSPRQGCRIHFWGGAGHILLSNWLGEHWNAKSAEITYSLTSTLSYKGRCWNQSCSQIFMFSRGEGFNLWAEKSAHRPDHRITLRSRGLL